MRDGSHRITCSNVYPCCWWQWFGTLSYWVPCWRKRVIGSGAWGATASAALFVCLCSQLQKQGDKIAHIFYAVLPRPRWVTSLPMSQNKPVLEFFLLDILSQLYMKTNILILVDVITLPGIPYEGNILELNTRGLNLGSVTWYLGLQRVSTYLGVTVSWWDMRITTPRPKGYANGTQRCGKDNVPSTQQILVGGGLSPSC